MSEYVNKEVCEKIHRRVDERHTHHDRWLGEHEKKIDCLEKSDATNTNEIKNLCSQISSQTKAIWGLVVSILMILISFFIWYVQGLS